MLYDLANDDGYVAHKRAADDRKDGNTEKGREKPALQQKTADMSLDSVDRLDLWEGFPCQRNSTVPC